MKYLLLSLISALLLSISWPTYGIPFFIFLAFVPLLMVEHEITKFSNIKIKRKSWAVFGLSYLVFLIWNIVTTGWLYNSLNPDGTHSKMAVVFPVVVNSLLMSFTFQLYHWYKKLQGTYFGLVFFVAIWIGFEKLHLEWEFTWPWLNLGNVFADYHQYIQWYDTVGAMGGSVWILIINVFVFYTIRIWEAGRVRKELIKNSAISLLIITVPMLISFWKYHHTELISKGSVNVVLLQPDLNPYTEKYEKDSLEIVKDLLTISEKYGKGKVDFYIAPETAFPGKGGISENGFQYSLMINKIKKFIAQKPQSSFVSGISSYRIYENPEEKSETAFMDSSGSVWLDSYNSAIQISPSKNIEIYHKAKLVPGVEIFPYINLLKPILGNVMLNMGGTVASLGTDKERSIFINSVNSAKLAPIICYESIYGAYVTDYVKKGANLLTIMTNDSWWGYSQGHKQLLAYAKLRAIETRREIVRSANSGTSAHINTKGDIVEDLPYGMQGALQVKANLYEEMTIYSKYGDVIPRILLFVLGFLITYTFIKKIGKSKSKIH
ncbi:MAG: apolipoprotein N-acyltransferase [Cloacibacterium sp.]|nr:apolipoprotein N-acyltransferase [Cloacibacterium sp.]